MTERAVSHPCDSGSEILIYCQRIYAVPSKILRATSPKIQSLVKPPPEDEHTAHMAEDGGNSRPK